MPYNNTRKSKSILILVCTAYWLLSQELMYTETDFLEEKPRQLLFKKKEIDFQKCMNC